MTGGAAMCKKELDDKVRECGTAYGMEIYSTPELFSLVTSIDPGKFTGSLQEILEHPASIEGIGKRKELALCAVRELGKRMAQKAARQIDIIHGPEDAARFASPYFQQESREHFAVLLLNTKNHVLGLRTVSIGSLTASIVHPREVFELAVTHHAAAIILLHNHPSGDPSPSSEDVAVTRRLVKAGKVMDIPVLDHVIIGNGCFASLKERGLMEG